MSRLSARGARGVVMPMSKERLIEAIVEANPSARPEFLMRFHERDLDEYLRRLTTLHNHRGRLSVWQRHEGPRAVCCSARRRPAA